MLDRSIYALLQQRFGLMSRLLYRNRSYRPVAEMLPQAGLQYPQRNMDGMRTSFNRQHAGRDLGRQQSLRNGSLDYGLVLWPRENLSS